MEQELFNHTITSNRELIFNQIDVKERSEATVANNVDDILTKAMQIALFGAGHTHPDLDIVTKNGDGVHYDPVGTLEKTAKPSARASEYGKNMLRDFKPILYRSSDATSKSNHALFIAARIGFSVYGSGESKYPTIDPKLGGGMFFYSQFNNTK